MKQLAALVLTAVVLSSSPAHACMSSSPNATVWAQCAYKAAYAVKEHKFLQNYALAVVRKQKLVGSAKSRWQKLEPRIVRDCGSYEGAAQKDKDSGGEMPGGVFIPKDQFWAIAHAGNIDKLVKN